jgi:hypothetical protein
LRERTFHCLERPALILRELSHLQQILQRSAARQRQEAQLKEMRVAELEAQLAKAHLDAKELSGQVQERDAALRNQTAEANELKELLRR